MLADKEQDEASKPMELVDELGASATDWSADALTVAARCKALSARLFSPEAAVKQLVAALG